MILTAICVTSTERGSVLLTARRGQRRRMWTGVADLYDINHDERIGRGEALSAIDDYFRGAITREEMLGIIDLYESA